MKKLIYYIFFNFIFYFFSFSQTTQVQFGKNRVQYNKIKWQTTETPYYDLYFYNESKEIAALIGTTAQNEIEKLIEKLSYSYRKKIDILVFNNFLDYTQHNIGLNNEVFNVGGTTKIYDNKIFIYFNGNHQQLQNDLRFAIAEVMLKQMMRGNGLGQRFLSILLLRLPNWYKPGVANYVAYNWDSHDDNELRQLFLSDKDFSFNKLSNQRTVLAGKSFWHMIAEEYGFDAISNILYLTRVNHNLNNGFRIATGKKLESLIDDWEIFYKKRYATDSQNKNDFVVSSQIAKSKKNTITNFVSNSIGNKQAYTLNNYKNTYKVFLLENDKTKKLIANRLKIESQHTNFFSTSIAWSKDGNELAIIENKNKKVSITIYNTLTKKATKKTIPTIENVFGADFTFNNQTLILSAQKNGNVDLYQYNITSNAIKQLNQTIFDDLYPKVIRIDGKEQILYSSNETVNEIGDIISYQFENLDLFITDLNATTSKRLTETKDGNEIAIGSYDGTHYTFLSDENGIYNQYIGYLSNLYTQSDTTINDNDTTIQEYFVSKGINSPITNFKYNIKHLAVSDQNNLYIYENIINNKKIYQIQKTSKSNDKKLLPLKPTTRITNAVDDTPVKQEKITTEQPIVVATATDDSFYNASFPYTFQTKYKNKMDSSASNTVSNTTNNPTQTPVNITILPNQSSTKKFISYTNLKKQNSQVYKPKFATDFFTAQLDNSLIHTYQSVAQNLGTYRFPEIGILLNVGISDIMENHKLKASIRMPVDFSGTEINIRYDNLKNRIDYYLSIYRRSNKINFVFRDLQSAPPVNYDRTARTATYVAEAGISLPIDFTQSIKISGSYRNEKFVPLLTEIQTLSMESYKENWVNAKVEYVYDNTKDIQFNIPSGLKFKIFGEYFKNINKDKSTIYNVGFDIRYYQKIHKNFIWANRFAFASSFGSQKLLYFLGGVDSWFFQKYDNSIPIDENISYGLQAPVNNMRGLPQNIRNGSNYLIWNSELRLPLFSYLSRRPMQSDFLRDFQIIGFCDVGMAYNKPNPFDGENAYISKYVNDKILNPVSVNAKYYRNPFVFGFGAGIRTNILGYFIRMDAGWGHDGSSIRNKPLFHLSLSKDF